MFVEIPVRTHNHTEFIQLDSEIQSIVAKSGVKNGLCTVFAPHTTAAITINENADPDVVRDIIAETEKIIPWNDGYHHMEGNSAAHIKSSLFGASETVLIRDGRLKLGTWQSIYFCEFDGPRHRKVWIQIVGD
ncbi:MAG: YjbQ family protein [Calditrichaeota bacterium]|nr:YjbQ family protein [Calditrichota bacterium]